MTGWIGISLGDIAGIGPEVTLKALAAQPQGEQTRYLLIGDPRCLESINVDLRLGLELKRFEGPESKGRFFWVDPEEPLAENLPLGSPAAAKAALAWLSDGVQRCLRHELDALVTAPVNKESILRSGIPFIGQTEFISNLAGTDQTRMMLLGDDERGRWIRVALVTTHVPLRHVADQVTADKVALTIELAAKACADLNLEKPRIGVCGLNPHAGEGGELGGEEESIIVPAVESAANKGINVSGPYSADSLFYRAYHGEFDAVVAMYHDQGLIPMKMIGFERGVNWTLGLPFPRTSPDHGTAYDIAGQGRANPSSMMSAVRLAKQLASHG